VIGLKIRGELKSVSTWGGKPDAGARPNLLKKELVLTGHPTTCRVARSMHRNLIVGTRLAIGLVRGRLPQRVWRG
jgi:hypothetical protein